MPKRVAFLLLVCGICRWAVAPAITVAEDSAIKIGAILMLTGDQAVYGNAMRQGIELAREEINHAGGIGKRKLTVILEDSQLKPKEAHTAAVRLVTQEKISAAINASFIEVMANGSVFEKAKIPAITLWDSSEEIEKLGDYIFGVGVWSPSSANRAAEFSSSDLRAKTAVIINLHAEWSETVGKLFAARFESLGGKVLKVFTLLPSSTDFRTVLLQAKALGADVLYTPLTENIVPFYTQLHAMQLTAPVVTSDIIADEHIRSNPTVFEGIYQTNPADPDSPAAQRLLQKYRERYGRTANLPLFVAWGYDAVHLFARAIEQAGENPQKIKDFLYSVRGYPGASGTISFNSRGSSPVLEKMYRIKNGKFKLVG